MRRTPPCAAIRQPYSAGASVRVGNAWPRAPLDNAHLCVFPRLLVPDTAAMERTPPPQRVVIALTPAEFGRLSDLAQAQDRDPYSQAQHFVRAALKTSAPAPDCKQKEETP